MKKNLCIMVILAASLLFAGTALAHTPMCTCYDNGDGTIFCEGGFSDGSSASGVEIRIENAGGKIIFKGKMDEFSEFSCDKPEGKYKVIFDAGPGHVVEVDGQDIVE
ncbi:MAG: hypothetical protein U9P80_02750 [Thermodesulfobacteriota bacterium]|nr:hypothetical protein [Thermodesulfobacteriota bacterium]